MFSDCGVASEHRKRSGDLAVVAYLKARQYIAVRQMLELHRGGQHV